MMDELQDQVEALEESLDNDEPTITREEPVVETLETDPEVELAKKHGLLPEENDDDATEETEPETEVDGEETVTEETDGTESVDEVREEDEKEVTHSKDLDDVFEDMSEDPKTEHEQLNSFNKAQQSFYWKWKKDKQKRQEIEAKMELQQLELNQLKAQITDKSKDPLDKLIEDAEANKPLTRKEYAEEKARIQEAQARQQAVRQRMAKQNAEALNKYSDYSETLSLAKEVMASDVTGMYHRMFIEAAENPHANSADVAYKIGQLHPKYGEHKIVPQENKQAKKVAEKITKNSQKGRPASSIPEGRNLSNIPESELKPQDCLNMSTEKWRALDPKTKKRILQESCV